MLGFVAEGSVERARRVGQHLKSHGLFADDVGAGIFTVEFFVHFGGLDVDEGGAEGPDTPDLPARRGHLEYELMFHSIFRREIVLCIFHHLIERIRIFCLKNDGSRAEAVFHGIAGGFGFAFRRLGAA